MNNQYVGDIGDFGKYALLSELSGGLKLAVIWYLTPDNQGKFTRYLNLDTEEYRPGECERNEQMYQSCNPELYKKLGLIVASNKRTVGEIEQKGVLPSNTKYYNRALTKDNREQWFTDAVEAVRDCDLVFLDPNNGFTTTNPTSPGHVQIDEVRRLFDRGQSLIVYHHLERRIEGQAKNGEEQVAYWRTKIETALQGEVNGKILVLWYHRGTARVYFIIPQGKHCGLLDAVASFIRGPWGRGSKPHFTLP